jgi:RNA polymerase sigma factor (TIGR02999 family)
MTNSKQEVTQLLLAWRNGDREAFDRLVPIVYDELRRLAHRYIAKKLAGRTLQTTDLVNEAYLRMVGQDQIAWHNRAHFFAVAAQVMRSLLVDRARSRQAAKRGGGGRQVSLDEAAVIVPERDVNILALNEALERLAAFDSRKLRIVELRYFGGLSVEETAEVMSLSPITIKREWLKAKAWLYSELNRAL